MGGLVSLGLIMMFAIFYIPFALHEPTKAFVGVIIVIAGGILGAVMTIKNRDTK